ncbi:zinc finger protein ZAT4-like [Tripterygium wilfordii]|uniref:zinc finger protein ZAT4-like n=1 Tax=Tripterygium wilfordii TaxID=458696 RepID=UPI0018F8525F|nr:zinc finger protein ZAT4-like [Tripterygium wilfordii]
MGEYQEFRHECKFCRKRFQCGRSLGGHMRSHNINDTDGKLNTDHESTGYGLRENPRKTWRFTDHSTEDLDSTSEAEAAVSNRRSKRITRYCMMTTADSSLSLTNASSSVTDIEQEQEEVAMCLIMLSKDACNRSRFEFLAEYSDNNSVSLDAPSSTQTSKNASKIMKPEDFVDAIMKREKIETNKTRPDQASYDSSKRKSSNHFDPDCSKRFRIDASDSKFFNSSNKRNKFECTSCSKTFRSYQALGGHRASHKKNKGCFASGINSSNSSTETAGRSSVEHFIEHCDNKTERGVRTKKRSEGHQCSVCLKVFSSGQALGGHEITFSPSTFNNHLQRLEISLLSIFLLLLLKKRTMRSK